MTSNYSFSHELKIDADIQRLKQPLSKEASMELRQQLLSFGCHEPLLIWDGIIIDGTNRYDICKGNNIAFHTEPAPVTSKDEAIVFVCKQQLLREDLTNEMRKYLIGRLYRAEVNAKTTKTFNSNRIRRQYALGKTSRKQDILLEVSSYLGLSGGTVLKYGTFSKCVDNIRKNDPAIAKGILEGRIKISHENIMRLEGCSAWELKLIGNAIDLDKESHIRSSDISKALSHRAVADPLPASKAKTFDDSDLPIRKMPVYDPDSDISNLIYTIPAWINSVNRAQTNTDFQKISVAAKERTLAQLNRLLLAVISLEEDLRKEQ